MTSTPVVDKRSEDAVAFPYKSLKIKNRPGLVDTTGSVIVLNELDKFTGKIMEFDGIVNGCAILLG